MNIIHITKAKIYNEQWHTGYKWIMPFVNSELSGCDLAIAGLGGDMVLITREGKVVQKIENY